MPIDPKEVNKIESSMVHDAEEDAQNKSEDSKLHLLGWVALGIVIAGILGLVFIWVFRSAVH